MPLTPPPPPHTHTHNLYAWMLVYCAGTVAQFVVVLSNRCDKSVNLSSYFPYYMCPTCAAPTCPSSVLCRSPWPVHHVVYMYPAPSSGLCQPILSCAVCHVAGAPLPSETSSSHRPFPWANASLTPYNAHLATVLSLWAATSPAQLAIL